MILRFFGVLCAFAALVLLFRLMWIEVRTFREQRSSLYASGALVILGISLSVGWVWAVFDDDTAIDRSFGPDPTATSTTSTTTTTVLLPTSTTIGS